jgi:hypothetical protein
MIEIRPSVTALAAAAFLATTAEAETVLTFGGSDAVGSCSTGRMRCSRSWSTSAPRVSSNNAGGNAARRDRPNGYEGVALSRSALVPGSGSIHP